MNTPNNIAKALRVIIYALGLKSGLTKRQAKVLQDLIMSEPFASLTADKVFDLLERSKL